MNILARVFDQLARMGLAFKSDPLHVIETEGREWGAVVGGLDLSVALRKDQKDLLSIILRNLETVEKRIVTHGWLHFLKVHLTAPNGSEAQLSAYGRQALDPTQAKSSVAVHLGPNEMTETEIPIGIFYDMSAPGCYRLRISCELPTGVLTSNECPVEHS